MKRCPQCEFIYEDDQSLCDMDGVLLVFDSRSLPNLHALAPGEAAALAPARAHWRHRTFPAMAALILATVFSLVYFVSTQRSVSTSAPISGASVTEPLANSAVPSNSPDSNQAQPSPAAETNGEVAETTAPKREDNAKAPATAAAATAPAKKPAAAKSATQSKPVEASAREPKKDDSKVGSLLKKTGNILKKPFKH